jgi:hypothetical protein
LKTAVRSPAAVAAGMQVLTVVYSAVLNKNLADRGTAKDAFTISTLVITIQLRKSQS